MTPITGHRHSNKPRVLLSLVLSMVPILVGAQGLAGADTAEPLYRFGLEVFSTPNSFGVDPIGFRASYALSEKWTLEGSFSFGDDDSTSFLGSRHVEESYLDFSIRRKIIRNRRLDFFIFGGVGGYRSNWDFQFDPDGWPADSIPPAEAIEEESLTLNLGIGLEVNIGRRFFFRSDLRHRATDLDHLDTLVTYGGQLSLGLGLKW